ncbi:MAG: NADH-quinone oxidoreductase subunit C [Chloroflexi bacterium]|nr:NADH-quinone oxidoreductase subunit C [Chloroflexota bacterium]
MALERTPDMEGLTPAERAVLYKQRASAMGIGRAPNTSGAAEAAPAAPAESMAAPPAQVPTVAAAAPAPAASAPAAPPARVAEPEPPKPPADPAYVTAVLARAPGAAWERRHTYVEIKVPRESLLPAARTLREHGFDYLSFVTEVDWKDRFEMLYHLFSYDFSREPGGVVLRTDLPREGIPEVASMTAVWPGAEYMERECAEMLGIRFLGHPDLRKILLPDDFVGYPMRKDYETDFEYITVKHLVREFDGDYQG